MSECTLSANEHKARKQYTCIWCGQRIESGGRYVRTTQKIDGDLSTYKWHPECNQAFDEEAGNGWMDFDPWDNERPEPTPKHGETA